MAMDAKYTDVETFLHDMETEKLVSEMKRYVQHGRVSTYEHCVSVVRLSLGINRAFHLNADMDSLLKGAMLHDFYLYDWHDDDNVAHKWHGFFHAQKASRNAKKYFRVNRKIQHIIESHMWPLNITRVPHSREAWIVCLADKYVSFFETVFGR